MKKLKHIQSINEWYKYPNDIDIFNIPEHTYVDKVFDDLVEIILRENKISEKAFKDVDNTINYVRSFFDNNQDIMLIIDEFNSDNKRSNYCAEHLYYIHFQNNDKIT